MKTAASKTICTIGLMGVSVAAMAGEAKTAPPQEPVGFIAGAVIGGFAAGPVGVVVGAGLGTWLGNRVHRAGEARAAEAQVAKLQAERQTLEGDNPVEPTSAYASEVLDGLQGDVLFRTGSAEITPEIAHQIQVIAQAVAKSPQLKVRIDGYTDPRGSDETNMKLSQDRANAVRDMLLAAGVGESVLEVNAYGKTQSVATDSDGYALERRVRLTLRMDTPAAVAQAGEN